MANKVVQAMLVTLFMSTGLAHALNPIAQDDTFVGDEDTTITGNVLVNDVPGDPMNTIQVLTHSSPGIGETFSISPGGAMSFTAPTDANGTFVVGYVITEDDPACILLLQPGCFTSALLTIQVDPVNDQPFAVGGVPAPAHVEDDVPAPVSLAGLFDDVDIATNSQTLTVELVDAGDAGLIENVVVSGDTLTYELVANASGTTNVVVAARDSSGAPNSVSAPLAIPITVSPLFDDQPIANDDAITIDEDSGPVTITVLDNDFLEDAPVNIIAFTTPADQLVLDLVGDPEPVSAGTVANLSNELVFTPGANVVGDITFQYTIADGDGDTDTGTVTVTIDRVNDVPEAQDVTGVYQTFENALLTIDEAAGLEGFVFDIDNALFEDPTAPQPFVFGLVTNTPSAQGNVLLAPDGSFTFQPAIGFSGTATFQYQVSDNVGVSAPATVEITVTPLPPSNPPPNPGEVAVLYNLSNTPLEQASSVEPNVLVTMDDSGSMDWNMSMLAGGDDNGRFQISNAGVSNSGIRTRVYSYLWPLASNEYPATSNCCGRILPTHESLAFDPLRQANANVWQAWSAAFNRIYYNPEVTYEPWDGRNTADVDFADAVPNAVLLNPFAGNATINILVNTPDYLSESVPQFDNNGGSNNLTTPGYYIPRYYLADGTLVEIRAGSNFAGGPERDDCSDPAGPNTNTCTFDEEIQNFANWFQYYRSREHVAKAAIGGVTADLQDIRVGYETLNGSSNEQIAPMNEFYWEGEKRELLDAIYTANSNGGTPLRRSLERAGRILGCDEPNRACPQLPEPEGICQQNFTLLFSDGYWNGNDPVNDDNYDQNGPGPFDGGKYADTFDETLADVAMFFYENDLHPTTTNGVPLSNADIEGAPTGTFPSVNSTIHQHMKTYTIAFGVQGQVNVAAAEAEDPAGTIAWPDPEGPVTGKVDDMLHAAINGRGRFLNAGDPQELRTSIETAFLEFTQAASSTSAAAFNSTSLRSGTLLYRGFYDLRNRNGELTATAVDTSGVLAATPTWKAAELLDATFPGGVAAADRHIVTWNPTLYSGVGFDFGNLTPAQAMTLNANEVEYMRGVRTFEEPAGNLRARETTEGLLGDIVNSSSVFVGEPNFINRDQAPFPTDELYSDFVDAASSRQSMVYVGANDGMLHGFDAQTGVEQMAFVPNMILDSTARFSNKLNAFTSTFYLHDYYVDLSPRLNDVYIDKDGNGTKEWTTVLIGGLGAGGKGFFALDVTNPGTQFATESTTANSVLWEFTDVNDTYPEDVNGNPIGGGSVLTDFDGQEVRDLGVALSLPVITMSNDLDTDSNNHWVAIFGNGPNSTAGFATLFVLYIQEGIDDWTDNGDFVKIPTGFGVPLPGEQLEGFPNGLGSPSAIDVDLNGTVDYVYAGDALGNLWRFDLTSDNPDNWEAVRLFTATYPVGGVDVRQPLPNRPLVVKHPDRPGFLVTVGTGSFVTEEDGSDTSIQSIYTIWDELGSNPPTANANTRADRLVEQTITNVVDDGVSPAVTRRILSGNPVSYISETGSPGTYGWYIDFDQERATDTISGNTNPDTSGNATGPQFPGERAIRRFLFRDGAIITTTVLPATDETACFGARPGALMVIDALTGGDHQAPVIDFNQDGYVDENDLLTVNGTEYSSSLVFDYQDLDGALVDLSTLGGVGDTDFLFVSGGNDTVSFRIRDLADIKTGRLSWTQLEE